MSILEHAKALPRSKQIKLMEALWSDLSLMEEVLPSPSGHEAALLKTEACVATGEEQQIDWDEARQLLRA
jgi:hypothetical protein